MNEGNDHHLDEPVITLHGVTRQFQTETVLKDVSAVFAKGKIHGIIGRNGSGKTMLFKCICGFVPLSSGTITVNGKKIGKDIEVPDHVGMVIEAPSFLPNYSGYGNLRLLASINHLVGKEAIYSTMVKVGLNPDSKKQVRTYSMGMRQRLGIAQAIMENQQLIILDEPMNGLDHAGVREIRALLKGLREEGKTILIASHNTEDVSELCDTICEMDAGVLRSIFPA